MKKLFAILMSIMMIACFMPTMAFAEGTLTVTIGLGTGMKLPDGVDNSGLSQNKVGGDTEIKPITINAETAYYFPEDYKGAEDLKGLTVTVGAGGRSITISGKPTDSVNITLTAATEKQPANLTGVKFTATGSDTGELTGVSVGGGYSYKINDGNAVTIDGSNCTEGKVALTELKKDDKITVMKAGNDTTKPGSTPFTVDQKDPPAKGTITATNCTVKGKDGKLTGVTAAMEYQKEGASKWTEGTGAVIPELEAGTYYVRTKAADTALTSTNLELEIKGYPTATADVPDVIRGITTVELEAQHITITLTSATLNGVEKGNDVSAWFDTLPAGLKATVNEVKNNTVTITISGTPTKEGKATAKITIPKNKLVDGKEGGLPVANDVTFSIAKYYHVVTGGGGGGAAAKPTKPTTPEQKPATAAGKTAANAAITTAAAANKYDKAEQAEVDQIVKEAEAKIKEAKTEDEVKAIQKDAETKLDKILTTEEKATIASLEEVSKRDFGTKSKKITKKNGKKAVKLSWAAPEGVDVDGYEIFRSTKKNSGYGTEPYFETPKTSYTNSKGLKSGKTYYYRVRAYVEINGERHYTDYSTKASRKI